MLRKLGDVCKSHILGDGVLRNLATRSFSDSAGNSASKQSRSMLDSTSQLGAAEGVFQGASAAAAAAAAAKAGANMGAEGAARPGILHRIFGAFVDVGLVAVVGVAGFGGYLHYNYTDEQLQSMLDDYKNSAAEQSVPAQVWSTGIDYYLQYVGPLKQRIKSYTDPSVEKLLPDRDPNYPPLMKTLVLDLESLLVHKEWTRERGWQVYKRPGVQDFILQLLPYYEVVIFTDEISQYAEPIVRKLVAGLPVPALYRNETTYHEGKHVRDLSKLNRDIPSVLYISANPNSWSFQPENTLKLKPWQHDFKDTTLLDLIPFLQMVARTEVKDVRDVVRSYDGEEDVVAAFKARMQLLVEHSKQKKGALWR